MSGRATFRWMLGLLLALALVVAGCGTDDAAPDEDPEDVAAEDDGIEGPEVTLNLGHPFPAEHLVQVNMIEPWAEDVSEATDGTVTIEIHPGGALTAPPAAYENTVAGVIDLGWALHGYTPGRVPVTEIVELPFAFDSAERATEVLWDLYEEFPAFEEEFADVKVIALWTHDVGDLFTTGGPVHAMEDIAGLTLRAPGPMQTTLIESLGGTAVNLPAPELYDALERGVIDGLMIAATGVSSYTLHEVLQHGTRGNFYVAAQFLVMNQEAWDALSPSQQEAIDEISGRELSLVAARAYDEAYAEVVAQYEDLGLEIHELTPEEAEQWRDATEGVPVQWIEEREAEGVPGQQMYDRLIELAGAS